MNEVRKALTEPQATHLYVAPHAKVVHFQSEGVLCISKFGVGTQKFEEKDFSNGSFWD